VGAFTGEENPAGEAKFQARACGIDYAAMKNMRNKIIAALVLALSGFAVGRASQPAPARIYEMRTYTTNEGKLEALNARFRNHTTRIFARHNIKSVGYWVPSEGPLSTTTLIYILEHPSREEAAKNWKAFMADPEWQKVRAESEKDGRILAKAPESVFMNATDYSAIK
jgi:hypothetical protein